jgi:hypothetical protein
VISKRPNDPLARLADFRERRAIERQVVAEPPILSEPDSHRTNTPQIHIGTDEDRVVAEAIAGRGGLQRRTHIDKLV